jgi:hypothetical protein
MWDKVLQLLAVSCRHRHISQPFPAGLSNNSRRSSRDTEWEPVSPAPAGHYVVCLDCGKHFDYDWTRMRVLK